MNRTLHIAKQTPKVIRTFNQARTMSSAGPDGSHIGGQLNKKEKAEENRWVRQEEAKRKAKETETTTEGTPSDENVKATKIQPPMTDQNPICTIL